MTCAILCVARDEDKYLEEFIQYHFNIGFDYIFLIDNNDKNNMYQNFKYPNKLFIQHKNEIPMRNIPSGQIKLYDECNKTLISKKNVDYLLIIDADEFLHIKTYHNVKQFIQKEMIDKNINMVEIQWETYDDNNIIFQNEEKNSIIKMMN